MQAPINPKMNSRQKQGGDAIAAGGFGCVFRPALRCEGKKNRDKNKISKMLSETHAYDEMEEVKNARKILNKISNYEKYFALTGYSQCIPETLTTEDGKNFDKKCASPLQTTLKRINTQYHVRQGYNIINSPDLGIDVSKAIHSLFKNIKNKNDIYKFLVKLNNSSVDTLKNGIKKMSKLNFYHSDVKPQNLMTNFDINDPDKSFDYMKLIDFGLALPEDSTHEDVNSNFLFNYPFSSCLFDYYSLSSFNRKLTRAYKAANTEDASKVRPFLKKEVENFVNSIINSRIGHTPYMIYNGTKAYNMKSEKLFVTKVFQPLLVNYLTEVLLVNNYVYNINNVVFTPDDYWNYAYCFNLDVWGFLQTYIQLAADAFENKFTDIGKDYLEIIKKYIYTTEYSNKEIPVDSVINDINKLTKKYTNKIPKNKNVLINNKPTNKTQKKLVVVKKLGSKNKTISKSNSKSVITLVGKKCPNGFVRHKTMKNKCVKKLVAKPKSISKYSLVGKRCPNGFVRHKTMKNKCVRK